MEKCFLPVRCSFLEPLSMFTNLPRVSPPQAASLMAGRIPQPWGEAPGPQPDECLHDSLRAGRAGCGGVSPCAPVPLHSGFFPARCGGVHPAAPPGWGLSRKWYKAVSEGSGSGSGSGMSPLHPASRTVRVLPQLLAGAVAHRACVQAPRPPRAGAAGLEVPSSPTPSPRGLRPALGCQALIQVKLHKLGTYFML